MPRQRKILMGRFNPRETVAMQNVKYSCPIIVIVTGHAEALILC
jgi:hypothetical protein